MDNTPDRDGGDSNKPDPRLPGHRQGVADRPGYPDDDEDDDANETTDDDEVTDPSAEPGKPI